MGQIHKGEPFRHLHNPDGTHATTARTANGRDVELHENAIRRHMANHRYAAAHRTPLPPGKLYQVEDLFAHDSIRLNTLNIDPGQRYPHTPENVAAGIVYSKPYGVLFERDAEDHGRFVQFTYIASRDQADEIDGVGEWSGSSRTGHALLAAESFGYLLRCAKHIEQNPHVEWTETETGWGYVAGEGALAAYLGILEIYRDPEPGDTSAFENAMNLATEARKFLGDVIFAEYLTLNIEQVS